MERGWIDTVQLLGLDIAALVIVVLIGLSAITARLAMDPAESALPALLARLQAWRSGTHEPSMTEAAGASVQPAAAAVEPETVTAEWLDRLLTGDRPQGAPASRTAPTRLTAPSGEKEVA